MGNLCCRSDTPVNPLHSSLGRTQSIRTGPHLNTEKLADRFSSQMKKLKNFKEQLEKGLELATNSKLNYCKTLERLDLHFSKKSANMPRTNLEIFECQSCFIIFNNDEEKPLDLDCGHNICKVCAKEKYAKFYYIECGIDGVATNSHPDNCVVNEKILESLEAIGKNLFCPDHLAKGVKFCLKCKKILCEKCFGEHAENNLKDLNDEEINSEFVAWEKNIAEYAQNLKKAKEKLGEHDEEIGIMKKKLKECMDKHIAEVNESRDELIKCLISASAVHMEDMNAFLEDFLKTLPLYNLKLYKDSIGQEIERAEEAISEFPSLSTGEKLQEVGKKSFRTDQYISKPDLAPWEDSCKHISEINDFEAFILALASSNN